MLNKEQADQSLRSFPSNYVGSKRKILPWMGEVWLKHQLLSEDRWWLDLFGGSGVVSYYLAQLGLARGYITDLMISSHLAHCSLFAPSNPAATPTLFELPPLVQLEGYTMTNLAATRPVRALAYDIFADDDELVEEERWVASAASYTSENKLFDALYGLLKHYILLHFTAKEAFELACALTNTVIQGQWLVQEQKVRCFDLDVLSFLDYAPWRTEGLACDPRQALVYLDPPYGGASSNYHKIYSVNECLAFATVQLRQLYNAAFVRCGTLEQALAQDYAPPRALIFKREWPHEVEELPHIKAHAWRFNTTDLLTFKLSFEKVLDKLVQHGFPLWIISFNADSSWIGPQELVELLERKYHCRVTVEKTDYNYAYRVNNQASEASMGELTIGEDADEVVGKKDQTSEEILYLCERG